MSKTRAMIALVPITIAISTLLDFIFWQFGFFGSRAMKVSFFIAIGVSAWVCSPAFLNREKEAEPRC